ncbi:hypothetical protein [Larkinella soli]|uniref:hypothetical protein n=1 Tax=Larkinella soli TaxID=1770527 RepID=UPI000FFBC1AE|nr:hypothetical protein [Larkinella soli]
MATIKVARYAIVPGSDTNRTIPSDASSDFRYPGFQAPDVDRQFKMIVTCNVTVLEDGVNLKMRMASSSDFFVNKDLEFIPGVERKFHATVLASDLRRRNNEVIVSVSGPGKVMISDIVILYTASIPLD